MCVCVSTGHRSQYGRTDSQPHRFEEYLGSVAQLQDEFDLRSLLGHLVDVDDGQRGHVLEQVVHVRPTRRRRSGVRGAIQLVLGDVVVKVLPRRLRLPVVTQSIQSILVVIL